MKNHGLFLVPRVHASAEEELPDVSEFAPFRKHAIALLRKYFRVAMDLGRMPSVLGGDVFHAKCSSYKVHTFEDLVIFVHDVERCLEKMDKRSLELIAMVVLMEYRLEEAAGLLGLSIQHVKRLYPEAIDNLSARLLAKRLIGGAEDELPRKRPVASVKPGGTVMAQTGD